MLFNLIRPNFYKKKQTLYDIVKEKNPDLPEKICILPTIIPDNMIHKEYINSNYNLCPIHFLINLRFYSLLSPSIQGVHIVCQ